MTTEIEGATAADLGRIDFVTEVAEIERRAVRLIATGGKEFKACKAAARQKLVGQGRCRPKLRMSDEELHIMIRWQSTGEKAKDIARDMNPVAKASDTNPTRMAIDPASTARTVLKHLQSAHGKAGAVLPADLRDAPNEMGNALDLDLPPWNAVARHFRPLIGDRRRQVERGGRKVRTYHLRPRHRPDCALTSEHAAA